MKTAMLILVASIVTTSSFALTPEELVKRQARSVHLSYAPTVRNAKAATGTVTVTETQTNSYFAILGWDCGYCGIQDCGARGNVLIFSVWDPCDPFDAKARPENMKPELRVLELYAAPNVNVARFGGEGTGARTMMPYNWNTNVPVTVKIDSEPYGTNRTAYTCFLKDGADWKKIATLATHSHPGRAQGLNGVHSFVEDFWRNGLSATLVRRAEFSDFATCGQDGKWIPAERAWFTGDSTPAEAIDAGTVAPGRFFLQTGGNTKNKTTRLNNFTGR